MLKSKNMYNRPSFKERPLSTNEFFPPNEVARDSMLSVGNSLHNPKHEPNLT